jgi:hypothetical protein
MLPAVELDNQPPVAADEIDVVRPNRFLANKFEPAELSIPKPSPKRGFSWGKRAP